MNCFTKLEDRVKEIDSLLCIGLDPHISQLPEPTAVAAEIFCLDIVTSTSAYAAAYKPNSAFFEAFGPEGFASLQRVINAIPKDIPIILDNKRGDIDTTAQAYASSSYDILKSDFVTLSPYIGWDSIHPFVTGPYCHKGAFILCKTSNASSKELQELNLADGKLLYEKIAQLSVEWNTNCESPRLGLVVGATDPVALRRVRSVVPEVWILCPGVGAQGGDAKSVCAASLRADGSGVLINMSRAISNAVNRGEAARLLRDEINVYRQACVASAHSTAEGENDNPSKSRKLNECEAETADGNTNMENIEDFQKEFLEFAIKMNVLQFGSFKLKSGRISPYFFNAGLFSCGHSLHSLGRYYAMALKRTHLSFDVIFGPAYKGIPLAAAVSMAWYELYKENKEFSYNRKEVKDHGEGGQLVGANLAGRKVIVVDDVITAGTAIRESVNILKQAGATLVGVVVCLDRQERTDQSAQLSAIQQVEAETGVPVTSVVRLRHLIAHIEGKARAAGCASGGSDGSDGDSELLNKIKAYRLQYGIDY